MRGCRCRSRRRRSSSPTTGAAAETAASSITTDDAPPAAHGVAPEAGEPGARVTRQAPRLRTARVKAPPLRDQVARARRPRRCDRPSSTTARSATRIVDSRWPAIEHGAAGDRGAQVLDEVALGLGVDGRHRVVEHEHARACDERAREGDALPLAAGEVDASLADQRVVAVWELLDERRHARRIAGREHLVPARRRGARRAGCRAAAPRTARAAASRVRPTRRSSDSASVAACRRRRAARGPRWGRRSAASG